MKKKRGEIILKVSQVSGDYHSFVHGQEQSIVFGLMSVLLAFITFRWFIIASHNPLAAFI